MRARGFRAFVLAMACTALTATGATAHPVQHGPDDGHLLGSGAWGDLRLISSLRLTNDPGRVADVTVNPAGTYAFLADWGAPDCAGPEVGGRTSPDAGAWVVDIRDLKNPTRVGFIPYHQDSRPGEGMQVMHLSTRRFTGDVLVMNSELCGPQGRGGFTLWDVTRPLKPFKLSTHFGDRGFNDTHETHSAFAWQAGDRAYAVIVDNIEWPDVDIMNITNPKRPRLIAEYDLNEHDVDQPSLGLTDSFIHDMVVKEIDGRFIMLVSYWDGGYVLLDVTDPRNAAFLGDTDYAAIDPMLFEQTGAMLPPEGNAHQAEFTADNEYFIATDEDFAPYSVGDFRITTGPSAGVYPSSEIGGAAPVTLLPDQRLNGPTVYGGYGCPNSAAIPPRSSVGLPALAPGEEAIVVLQRGPEDDPSAPEEACFPGEKAAEGIAAGYDAVVLVNRHHGDASLDEPYCGSGAFPLGQPIVAVCAEHATLHRLFGSTPNFALPYVAGTEPVRGQLGEYVDVDSVFNGWGYVHLFDAGTLADLDTFAIPEAHDTAYGNGYGNLTVHEVATDPVSWKDAYLSYYSGGIRSIEIVCNGGGCQLVETGGYLDPNGNDFWGVETFRRNGRTVILGSDRDSGLWILKATDS